MRELKCKLLGLILCRDFKRESCASYLELAVVQSEWDIEHSWQMLLMQNNGMGEKHEK